MKIQVVSKKRFFFSFSPESKAKSHLKVVSKAVTIMMMMLL